LLVDHEFELQALRIDAGTALKPTLCMPRPHEMLVTGAGGNQRDTTTLLFQIAGFRSKLEIRAGAGGHDIRFFHVPFGCRKPLGTEVETVVMGRRHDVETSPFQVMSHRWISHHEAANALTTRWPCQFVIIGEIHFKVAISHVGIAQKIPDSLEFWFFMHLERAAYHALTSQSHTPFTLSFHRRPLDGNSPTK